LVVVRLVILGQEFDEGISPSLSRPTKFDLGAAALSPMAAAICSAMRSAPEAAFSNSQSRHSFASVRVGTGRPIVIPLLCGRR
jgi:hypothetical protein